MADNIAITAGSGTSVATDDVSGNHYQMVKLAFGALDTANLVTSTATNPFPVALSDTDNAVLDNIQTAVELIDNAISGTEMQVDVVAALPAGTNAIGKLAANSGVDIGDVDVLSLPGVDTEGSALGSGMLMQGDDGTDRTNVLVDTDGHLQVDVLSGGGGGTQYAEDTAHTTGDTGTLSLVVRNDTLAALAGTDGDYAPLQVNATGALYIQEGSALDVSAATVTVDLGANNDVTIDNSSIVKAEDSVHGSGDAGVMALAVRQDSQVDFGADGDYVPLSIDANGALRVSGGGGGTEYTEDAATPADPVGGAVLLRREDAPVSVAADGDWVAQNATQYGAGYVQIVDSSGNFVDSFGGSGGTAAADDADFTAGTTQGTPAMGVYESSPTSVTDGDLGVVGISADRRLLTDTEVTAALPAGDNNIGNVDIASSVALDVSAATVTVDLGANNDVTIDNSSIVKAEDAVHSSGDSGVMALAVRNDTLAALAGADGDYAPLQVNASGALFIQEGAALDVSGATVTTTPAVTGGGTEAAAQRVTIANDSTGVVSVDDNGSSLTVDTAGGALDVSGATVTVDLGANNDVTATGNVAHDAADSGNPVKVGLKAVAHSSNPTAVAANDRTDWYANRHGVPFVMGGHPNALTEQLNVTDADGAQTNAAIVTVGASNKIVVTHITVTADNANTGDVQCRIGFGTASTPGNDAADVVLSHPGIAAGSGISIGNGGGIIGVGADNEDLRITCEDPAGGALDITVGYFTIES